MEKIAKYGVDAFYTGDIALNTISTLRQNNGIMTLDDLASYTAVVRQPQNITYRNTRIYSTVAPSSGAVVLSALKIFEGLSGNISHRSVSRFPEFFFVISTRAHSDPSIHLNTHRLIEATRFAYGQRTEYGDPAFTSNVSQLEAYFLTEAVVTQTRNKIVDNKTFPVTYYNPENYQVVIDNGTSHIAVIDKNGMAVSLTTTM